MIIVKRIDKSEFVGVVKYVIDKKELTELKGRNTSYLQGKK